MEVVKVVILIIFKYITTHIYRIYRDAEVSMVMCMQGQEYIPIFSISVWWESQVAMISQLQWNSVQILISKYHFPMEGTRAL